MKKPTSMDLVQLQLGSIEERESLGSLLLACHARIRRFCRLALTIGVKPELPAPEVKAAAAQCLRYFTEALALHVLDEEESIWPRLAGRAAGLDATMAQLRAQHFAHVARRDAVVAALRAVFQNPNEPVHHRRLAAAAATLETDFAEHLALEEADFIPQLARLLTEDESETILEELRARRRPTA